MIKAYFSRNIFLDLFYDERVGMRKIVANSVIKPNSDELFRSYVKQHGKKQRLGLGRKGHVATSVIHPVITFLLFFSELSFSEKKLS